MGKEGSSLYFGFRFFGRLFFRFCRIEKIGWKVIFVMGVFVRRCLRLLRVDGFCLDGFVLFLVGLKWVSGFIVVVMGI